MPRRHPHTPVLTSPEPFGCFAAAQLHVLEGDVLVDNKYGESQVSNNHNKNGNNLPPSEQGGNEVWTNYTHAENWAGGGRAANNDKLSLPGIILTIITELMYLVQCWEWTPWDARRGASGWGRKAEVESVLPPCGVVPRHVRFLFHRGPDRVVIYRWCQVSCHSQ